MFDPRPLCCSSLNTAVGGTKDTNIVDSESPYRGTNHRICMCLIVCMCVNFGTKLFLGGESVKPVKILNINFSDKKGVKW